MIPHIAKSWQLANDSAWALSFLRPWRHEHRLEGWQRRRLIPTVPGPAGPMTFDGTYGEALFGTSGKAGVNFSQAFLDITWAKKLNDTASLGIAGVLVAQMFKANGVLTFAGYTETFAASGGTVMPDSLSNNGTDWSFGAGVKVGAHWLASDRVSLGLSYQTKIWMNEFDDYADLFAESG